MTYFNIDNHIIKCYYYHTKRYEPRNDIRAYEKITAARNGGTAAGFLRQ